MFLCKKIYLDKKYSTFRVAPSIRSCWLAYILKIAKKAKSKKIKLIFNLHTQSFYMNK